MSLYKSHNYEGLALPIISFCMLFLINFIYYDSFGKFNYISIFISIIIFIFSIREAKNEIFDIYFEDDYVKIIYAYKKNDMIILYSEILEYKFIYVSKGRKNVIKTLKNKIKFRPIGVNINDSLEFMKWLNKKNENIKFVIYPKSSHLEYLRQKDSEIKYRKFLKETL